MRGQVAEVGERIEQLAGIAKVRIVQRHITHPDGGKAQAVDLADQRGLTIEHRHVAAVEAQRQEDTQGQVVGGEHASIAGVMGEGMGAGAR
ncbi:hypothetical protein D3C84_1164720 [compost metagenome]